MNQSNGRFFIGIIAVLAISVVAIELLLAFTKDSSTQDSITLSQIIPLPSDYDQDLLNRIEARKRYLLVSQEEFASGTTNTTTITPTPTL